MKSYTQHKQEVAGYRDVHETVQILEKIAAGQLHTLQRTAEALELYTHTMFNLMLRLETLSGRSLFSRSSSQRSTSNVELAVILSGDKGLVGDLWHKLYEKYHEHYYGKQVELLVIGERGQLLWPEGGLHKVTHFSFSDRFPTHQELIELANSLHNAVAMDLYSSVSVLYVEATSIITHEPVVTDLLPLLPRINMPQTASLEQHLGLPIVDVSYEELANDLMKKYLVNRLQQLSMEVALSEFS
ncbi:F0F1 ATP synthase subunit gamma, partial [Candidatus Kaiserbacteria bacterium]|nr:F0F1 ATP synthase subunit gamma [Candidatus Kaiserbacteria bacterium]